MTKEEKKKYVDAYNKLIDLVKDGCLKKETFDQAIRDLLFEIMSKFEKETTHDVSKVLGMTCLGCIYKDLTAVSYPCLSCKRIHECQSEDCYKEEEE